MPFVRYWLHNAWVKMGEEKMSKSLGNFITIRDGLEKVGGDGLRLWILTSHYRKPLTFTEETLEAAKHGAERLRTAARAPATDGDGGVDLAAYRERFTAAMDDDLNTPQALAVLFDLAKEVNRARDEGRGVARGAGRCSSSWPTCSACGSEQTRAVDRGGAVHRAAGADPQRAARGEAVAARRPRPRRPAALNVTLEDGPQGTTWKPES